MTCGFLNITGSSVQFLLEPIPEMDEKILSKRDKRFPKMLSIRIYTASERGGRGPSPLDFGIFVLTF